MSIEKVTLKYDQLSSNLGRYGLNQQFPTEFELYVCAFELINADGDTMSYFIFPVMPNSIQERIPTLSQVKKTNNGITALNTDTYVPHTITISGNFGRKFRFLLDGMSGSEFGGTFLEKDSKKFTLQSALKGISEMFDARVKTGYGTTKILESILETSRTRDSKGRPYTLVFHNLAFNRIQIVKVTEHYYAQDQNANMIWNYTVQMETVGDVKDYVVKPTKGQATLIGSAFTQESVQNVMDKGTSLLDKGIRRIF